MFEDDSSITAEITQSKEALGRVESEAEVISKQEAKEWAKFALVANRIECALPENTLKWKSIPYAGISKYDGEEHKEGPYATVVLETERFIVVWHSIQDEVLILLKRDPKILGKVFKKVLPRLPLLLVKASYDWPRRDTDLGAYVSCVNYDYNSEHQELYQLLQRMLAETLKQKTYDTQVTTEFKKLASFG